jgi:hypothetical protein
VDTTPSGDTFRSRLFDASPTYRVTDAAALRGSAASATGLLNNALVPAPSEKPDVNRLPACVATAPLNNASAMIALFPMSAMNTVSPTTAKPCGT